jgi:glycine betaine/proline transport system substrate-binding protein
MNKPLPRKFVPGVMFALACGCLGGANAAESQDPIKLTIHDWTGQYITTHIMGDVLTSMGYNVEYVQADYLAQFAGLETGDLTVAMEIWQTTGKEAMDTSLKTGKTIDLGETGMEAKEEWWFPAYMKEKCPGLPNWEALKSCGEAFATPETAPKGRYLAGPVTWGGFDEERVEALGVPFEVVHAGTDAAMFAELESAYQRKAPIMLWIYTPHWAPIKYEGEWIQFPEYEDTCYNDPAWGVNPEKTHDCGKPHGWIKKVAWKGGEAKWPKAYAAIRKFQIDNKTMGELVAKVDLEGGKVEDVVAEWMMNNESAWKPWTE